MAEPMAGVSEAREQAHGWYMLAPWSRAHSSTILLCMLGVCAIGARGRAREGGTQTRPTQRDLADTLRRSGSRPNTSRARRKTVRRVLQLIFGQRATLQLALTMKSKQANQRTPENGRVHVRSMLSLVFRSSLEVPAACMTSRGGRESTSSNAEGFPFGGSNRSASSHSARHNNCSSDSKSFRHMQGEHAHKHVRLAGGFLPPPHIDLLEREGQNVGLPVRKKHQHCKLGN